MTEKTTDSHHEMRDFECERCHELLDMAYNPVDNSPPSPGDLTLCISCGEAYVIADDMSMRRLDDKEFEDTDMQCGGELTRIRRAIVAATVVAAKMMQEGC